MAGTVHDADSAGDLMLLVGPDRESIRASSKVLSLASPVFDKMLGPHFAEGQALLKKDSPEKSAESPTEITLPDDDPEAMVLFCDTIHFKRHATPDIAFPLLAKMASLSEKYDCSLVLSSASEVWLSNLKGTKEGESCFVKMLCISYALGNHRAFARISREMIRVCTHDELARQKQEMDCTSLPETIIGKFTSSTINGLLSGHSTNPYAKSSPKIYALPTCPIYATGLDQSDSPYEERLY